VSAPSGPLSRTIRVVLAVKNEHPVEWARQVVVTDTVPDGFDYVWGSARIGAAPVAVTGSNPYQFTIDAIAPGPPVLVEYQIARRQRS
jgi:uncharacterized repeat protein (TIGR01451 family)